MTPDIQRAVEEAKAWDFHVPVSIAKPATEIGVPPGEYLGRVSFACGFLHRAPEVAALRARVSALEGALREASELLNRARTYVALSSGAHAKKLRDAIDAWQDRALSAPTVPNPE